MYKKFLKNWKNNIPLIVTIQALTDYFNKNRMCIIFIFFTVSFVLFLITLFYFNFSQIIQIIFL